MLTIAKWLTLVCILTCLETTFGQTIQTAVSQKASDRANQLYTAARYGDLESVQLLLGPQRPIDAQEGARTLAAAIEYNQSSLVNWFLIQGVLPDSYAVNGLIEHGDLATLKVALQQGAPIDGAIAKAIEVDDVDALDILFAHGASVTRPVKVAMGQYFGGQLPLALAVQFGYPDIIKRLIEHGANPVQQDPEGRRPIDFADLPETLAALGPKGRAASRALNAERRQLAVVSDSVCKKMEDPKSREALYSELKPLKQESFDNLEGLFRWGFNQQSPTGYLDYQGKQMLVGAYGYVHFSGDRAGPSNVPVRYVVAMRDGLPEDLLCTFDFRDGRDMRQTDEERLFNPNVEGSLVSRALFGEGRGGSRSLEVFLKAASVRSDLSFFLTPAGKIALLNTAIDENDPSAVRFLLQHGADPNLDTSIPSTKADFKSCKLPGQDSWCSFLRDQSPLVEAIARNRLGIAQILLRAGAKPNGHSDYFYTQAPMGHNPRVIHLLLAFGGQPRPEFIETLKRDRQTAILEDIAAHGVENVNLAPKPSEPLALLERGLQEYRSSDYANAILDLRELANHGNAVAQNTIGAMYLWGLGAARDPGAAYRWFKRSADQGNPAAMANLGYLYQSGLGVELDLPQADKWYLNAATAGDRRGQVMAPVVEMALQTHRVSRPEDPAGPFPDSWILAETGVKCNESIRSLLQSAESHLPQVQPDAQFYAGDSFDGSFYVGNMTINYPDLVAGLIEEYSWAGCFSDSGRLLDGNRMHGVGIRDTSGRAIVQALVSYGQTDRAFAFTYSSSRPNNQNDMLQGIIDETIALGHLDKATEYLQRLNVGDGATQLYQPFAQAEFPLAAAHRDNSTVALLTSPQIGKLSAAGYLRLSHAYLRLGQVPAASRALSSAADLTRAPDYKDAPLDFNLGIWRLMGIVQARIDPAAVSPFYQQLRFTTDSQRFSFLGGAIAGAWNAAEAHAWLLSMKRIAPAQPTNFAACRIADSLAFLGEYKQSLESLKVHSCYQHSDNENVASTIHIAILRGDFAAIPQFLPQNFISGNDARNPLDAAMFGYTLSHQYSDALATLREIGSYPKPNGYGEAQYFIAMTNFATDDFPYQAFKDELVRDRGALRFDPPVWLIGLYASCARVKGSDAATALTEGLSGEELALARIGIAKGLRNFGIPTRIFPIPYMDVADEY